VFNTTVARPAEVIPATYSLINMVNQTLHQRHGMIPVGPSIPGLLEQSGRFTNITPQDHFVPIGDWHQDPLMQVFGNDMRATLVRYGDSLKPMLKEAGYEEAALKRFFEHTYTSCTRCRD
jgi:hypothetical protein